MIGVIGHVDHGKTALVGALTGKDTDRLAQEKRRGISIELGFAHLGDGHGRIADFIDMPGHERFVRTMISGATGIDAVLLLVAANEGVKPQTLEHVEIAGLLGIARAVVAVSKCDLATREEAEAAAAAARELLMRCGFGAETPVIFTSVRDGRDIGELREVLLGLAGQGAERPVDGLIWLPIDRAFAMPGHGPVVTGTLRGRAVSPGDRLELLPARKKVRVRAVQVHGENVSAGLPGQRVALNLRGIEIGQVGRGMALAEADVLEPSEWLSIALRSVASAPDLRNGARLRVLAGTAEAEARLRLLDRAVLLPGEWCFAQLRLTVPAALPAGEHVILRRASPAMTLGGGRVLEPVTRRLRRNHPAVLERLRMLNDDLPHKVIEDEAARSPTTLRRLAQLTGKSPASVAGLLRGLPVTVAQNGEVRPHEERRTVLAPRRDEALEAGIAESVRAAGLKPPLPKELAGDAATHRAVERLLREGVLIRATDRDKGKELLFHRDAVAEARRILAPVLAGEDGLTVSEIAAALGISRKFCMPLLDHLDVVRFTKRMGDRRVLH